MYPQSMGRKYTTTIAQRSNQIKVAPKRFVASIMKRLWNISWDMRKQRNECLYYEQIDEELVG